MIPNRKLCDCRTGDLFRVERDPWMRVIFPSRALYQCSTCRGVMLVSPVEVAQAREQRRQLVQPVGVA